jgi:hypothetical protein
MNDNLPVWANIAQVISLPLAIVALIIQIASYFLPRHQPIQLAQAFAKVRPFLPYIIAASISFWLGSSLFGRSQNDVLPIPNFQSTITALNSTSVAQVSELQTTYPQLTKVAEATAVPAVPAVPAVTQVANAVPAVKETVIVIQTVVTTVEVPVIVTPTQTPPIPAEGDTPLESILEVGRTWESRGAEFTLEGYTPFVDQICANWRFVNNTGQDLLVRYSKNNFIATDTNTRQQLEVTGFSWSGYTYSMNDILKNGEVAINNHKEGTPGQVGALCIKLDPSKTSEIIITARDISARIKEAKWRVLLSLN